MLFDIQKMSLSNIIRGGGSRGVNPAADLSGVRRNGI